VADLGLTDLGRENYIGGRLVEVHEYFQERAIKQTYAHFIHRPLSTYLNSIIQEGCTLQKVMEPQLDEAIARQYQAQRYWHVPGHVVIHAVKSSKSSVSVSTATERLLLKKMKRTNQ
jgi:hypothetical protein